MGKLRMAGHQPLFAKDKENKGNEKNISTRLVINHSFFHEHGNACDGLRQPVVASIAKTIG